MMNIQYRIIKNTKKISSISINFTRRISDKISNKDKNKKFLSLDEFIYRSQVLKFYRKVIRTCYKVNDNDQAKDLIQYARGEFQINHQYQDPKDAKLQRNYVLTNGKNHFRDICKSMGLTGIKVDD